MDIDYINKKIKELNKLKKLLNMAIEEQDTIEDKVFKKYLEVENVSKVAAYINQLGYRLEGINYKRKYTASDISKIITDKNTKIKNNDLKQVVIKIFNSHKKGINRINW